MSMGWANQKRHDRRMKRRHRGSVKVTKVKKKKK